MKLENEYLPFLFEGDAIYVVKEDSDNEEVENVNYKASLKEEKQKVSEPENNTQTAIAENKPATKPVLILVDDEFTVAEKETLLKLLTAIQVKEQHFEIIKEHPENLKSLSSLKLFLSFHKDFIKDDQYQIHQLNATRVIYAHNLNELNRDAKKKVQLWNLLKTIVK